MASDVRSHVLDPVIERLAEFSALEPNWDSYGAAPITPTAIRIARRIAETVTSRHASEELPKLYVLHAVPLAHGGVQLEWDTADRSLEVAIGPDGRLAYLFLDRSSTQFCSLESEYATEDAVFELAGRLVDR